MGSSINPQLWGMIQRLAPRYGVDPRAAAAVSLMEGGGRFGERGDNGTSFGPWQLHVGGALPQGRGAQWANSPAGVSYALQRMGEVSRGLHGRAAIAAIVSRFERPAAPGPEIAGAIARYGGLGPGGAGGGVGGAGGRGGVGQGLGLPHVMGQQAQLAQMLMNFAQTGSTLTAGQTPLAQMVGSFQASQKPGVAASGPGIGPVSGKAGQALSFAKSAIGTPYRWGGESKSGFDCSGLVQWAFGHAGISVPRTSQEQIQHGRPVKWGSFHPGDLIFSNFEGPGAGASHVVIYLGHGKVIAAPHTGTNVQVEDVNLFRRNFVGARRYF